MVMPEMIQPGWTVVDSHGDDVGTVVSVDEHSLRVQRSGIGGHEVEIPKSACGYIEEGRVELSKRRDEVG